ncbi:MAG: cytochrome b N-terminal domain-containing protein [Chloroflexi bacterium]|uniref:Cytochrome b N-terminal domain-containing protein n=1 Tax=Candidatus Chlorohelix allophototropha TaxID=3003348 RepID=A0A8T7M9S7_9CHLR|nr:cytochrome b N-terminal domain-containing protein [Chloroflexota bacterium]WJW68878.1 cytochrome b N-terminal domain-containing protein [Chloroflexota bacterium L227-S17]
MANRVYEWVDERTGIKPAVDYVLYRRIPKSVNWWFTFGSASLTIFLIQVVSGIFLGMGYTPSTASVLRPDGVLSNEALESVRHITNTIPFGDWMRGFHRWGANMMVIVVMIHMVRVFFMGSYKYPRELTWFIGVGILLMVLGFSFTGYLLPWDNRAYWATQVGVKIGGAAPVLGPAVETILKGGPSLGAATLTRFYALHVLLLPVLTGLLIAVHMFLVIKIGISGQPPILNEKTSDSLFDTSSVKKKKAGRAFFPYIIFKDAVASVAIVGLIVLATIFWPLENSNPVDPNNSTSTLEGKSSTVYETSAGVRVEQDLAPDGTPYLDAKTNQPLYVDLKGNNVTLTASDIASLKQVQMAPQPEWYFLFLFQFLKIFPPELNLGLFTITGEAIGGIIVPTILLLLLLLAPVLDRGTKRSPLNRPIASLSMLVFLVACVVLTVLAINDLNAAVKPVAAATTTTTPAATTTAAGGATATTAAAVTTAAGGATATTAAGGTAATTGDATKGAALFRTVCQTCHSSMGKAPGPAGQPNLTNSANAGDPAYVRNNIRNGKNLMPAFDVSTISDAELENLVAYVASIRVK